MLWIVYHFWLWTFNQVVLGMFSSWLNIFKSSTRCSYLKIVNNWKTHPKTSSFFYISNWKLQTGYLFTFMPRDNCNSHFEKSCFDEGVFEAGYFVKPSFHFWDVRKNNSTNLQKKEFHVCSLRNSGGSTKWDLQTVYFCPGAIVNPV